MLRPVPLAAVVLAAVLPLVPAPAAPPEAPPPRPTLDPALLDWTPRPATGKAEPWEKATDKDWVDGRFRAMHTGPFLNCSMRYPLGKNQEMVYKATAVKLGDKGDAGVVFDRSTMRLAAGWSGGWLQHNDRRFGLMNTPTPKGEMIFANPAGPGWTDPDGKRDTARKPFTAPLPREWARYRGMYVHGNRVVFKYALDSVEVLDSPHLEGGDSATPGRTIEVGPHDKALTLRIAEAPTAFAAGAAGRHGVVSGAWIDDDHRLDVAMIAGPRSVRPAAVAVAPGRYEAQLRLDPADDTQRVQIIYNLASRATANEDQLTKYAAARPLPKPLTPLTKGGPRRWGEPVVTKLVRGVDAGPFAVDTLTIPYENRFKALFFCTGLDHLPDGRIAVCTCHGDVWLVTVDEKAATCSWQRYATGLYHPLGLKVVGGKVVVLETGQLTRLHDLNNDGEADFYECISNDWHTGGGEHSYDTCLETDPEGNFYFFKTGDTHTPHGGCLMRVAKDGGKVEVFATGFRHPIGMGMSPTGILTGADQEGNWMPATRIDEYRKGGFYGDLRAHHRKVAPKTFDPPLCWLPREVDNSAGGQVWVPEKTFGPLAGLPLHLSYGRCKPFVLLRQECAGGVVQGGVVGLDVQFLSGVCRGRFGPDGHLYVCGLNGWQTAAQADGCLQRVRYTGQAIDVPVKMAVEGTVIRLTFSRALDARSVANTTNYRAAWWNYVWSGEYGSKRWKVSDPAVEGQDEFAPRSAKLLGDGRTVELTFDKLVPVMQMQLGFNLDARDGRRAVGSVYLTINTTGR